VYLTYAYKYTVCFDNVLTTASWWWLWFDNR